MYSMYCEAPPPANAMRQVYLVSVLGGRGVGRELGTNVSVEQKRERNPAVGSIDVHFGRDAADGISPLLGVFSLWALNGEREAGCYYLNHVFSIVL